MRPSGAPRSRKRVSEKADRFAERYRGAILKDAGRCLGSYAFLWQWRHERTHTWYGLFLESGERRRRSTRWNTCGAGAGRPIVLRASSRRGSMGRRPSDNVYLQPGSSTRRTTKPRTPKAPRSTSLGNHAGSRPRGICGHGRAAFPAHAGIDCEARRRHTPVRGAASRRRVPRIRLRARRAGNAATANIPFYVNP